MLKLKGNISTKQSKGKIKIVSDYSNRHSSPKTVVTSSSTFEGANFGGGGSGKNNVSMSTIGASQRNNVDLTLTGLLDENQESQLHKIYRDIYHYDSVAGSAVDLQSSLPFSDFDLAGAEPEILNKYSSAIERLNFKTMNRFISTNYLVYGSFTGTLIYNRQHKSFTDLLPYDTQDCEFQYMPFASMDPVITVTPNQELKEFLNSSEEAIVKLRQQIPPNLIATMGEGSFVLDPLTTLYLCRRGPDSGKPISYYRRLLPIYLLEKTLLRGTLVEASKRQRSLMHVQAGDENWEPTPEELNALVALFQQADLDPLGPIIATRNGITAAEARQGGDFWKYTDIIDTTNALKLRALGISETFLSGETSYATAEIALSVFVENLKAYRDYYTQSIFYNKLFPVIAAVNGFKKTGVDKAGKPQSSPNLGFSVNDASSYIIPNVRWHKSLEPNNDHDTMDMLQMLADKGFPVTLRMWAAAGGLRIENILNEMDEDLKIRKELMEYSQKIQQLNEEHGGGDDGVTDNGLEDDLGEETATLARALARLQPVGLGNRNFDGGAEVVGRTVTGKKKLILDQKAAIEKQNRVIAKAAGSIRDPNVRRKAFNRSLRG